jgi:WD40 repeat protein
MTLASTSEDKTVMLWESGSGYWIDTAIVPPGRIYLRAVFSLDGRIMATSEGSCVALRSQSFGTKLVLLKQTFEVSGLVFSPDSKTLAVALDNGDVDLWECSPLDGRSTRDISNIGMQRNDEMLIDD